MRLLTVETLEFENLVGEVGHGVSHKTESDVREGIFGGRNWSQVEVRLCKRGY